MRRLTTAGFIALVALSLALLAVPRSSMGIPVDAQALKQRFQTCQNVVARIRYGDTFRGMQRIVFHGNQQGRIAIDTVEGRNRRWTLLDGILTLSYESLDSPRRMEKYEQGFQDMWSLLRSPQAEWTNERPEDFGLGKSAAGADVVRVVTPFPWASGIEVFLILPKGTDRLRRIDVFFPLGKRVNLGVVELEFDVELSPQTFDRNHPPDAHPFTNQPDNH